MGVKGLWRLLLPIGRRISIETLEGRILAIDASIWLTQFIKAMRDQESGSVRPAAHLIGFFRRLCKLRFNGIRPVLVFDGATPEIKLREIKERRKRREQFAFRGANSNDAFQRMAKRLLADNLKKRKLSKLISPKEAEERINKDDDPNESSKLSKTTPRSYSAAPGFYDPTLAAASQQEIESKSNRQEESSKIEEKYQTTTQQESSQDIIEILENENYLEDSNPIEQQQSDWDTVVLDTTILNPTRTTITSDVKPFVSASENDFDADYVSSLPSAQRKDWVEDARRKRRMLSRRDFMKVAYNEASFSNCQLKNFLKSSKLNQDIHKMATKVTQNDDGMGEALASDRTKRIIFEKDSEKQFSKKKQKDELLKEYRKQKLSLLASDSDDDSEEINWKIVGSKHKVGSTTNVRAIMDDSDSDEESHGEGCGFFGSNSTEYTSNHQIHDNNRNDNVSSDTSLSQGKSRNRQKPDDEVKLVKISKPGKSDKDAKFAQELQDQSIAIAIQNAEYSDDKGATFFSNTSSDEEGGGFLQTKNSEAGIETNTTLNENGWEKNLTANQDRNLALALQNAEYLSENEDTKSAGDIMQVKDPESPQESESCPSNIWKGNGFRTREFNSNSDPSVQIYDKRISMKKDSAFDYSDEGDKIEWEEGSYDKSNPSVHVYDGPISAMQGRASCDTSDEDERIELEGGGLIEKHYNESVSTRKFKAGENDSSDEENRIEWEEGADDIAVFDDGCKIDVDPSSQIKGISSKTIQSRPSEDDKTSTENKTSKSIVFNKVQVVDEYVEDDISVEWEDADNSGFQYNGNVNNVNVNDSCNVESRNSSKEDESYGLSFGDNSDPWNDEFGRIDSSSNEMVEALTHAQDTASRLTNWAGRAFRRAVAQHAEENGISVPAAATPKMLIPEPTSVRKYTIPSNPQNEVSSREIPEKRNEESNRKEKETTTKSLSAEGENRRLVLESIEALEQEWSAERKRQSREMDTVTDEMRAEVMHLLQLFGIPYVEAPAEAEAQCVMLEKLGLVDGIVTEDSDAFVFGGQVIYKNIFDDKKYVEVYNAKDAEAEMNLSREGMVGLAMVMGGDYTEGIRGVGIVNGMEIIHAFDVSEDVNEGLSKFKKWLDGNDLGGILGINASQTKGNTKEEIFYRKHNTARNRWNAPAHFPDRRVLTAYQNPVVDTSNGKFSWGIPDPDGLLVFCNKHIGWSPQETSALLKPVIKKLESGSMHQTRIDSFLRYEDNIKFADIRSKRLREVLSNLQKSEPDNALEEKSPKKRKFIDPVIIYKPKASSKSQFAKSVPVPMSASMPAPKSKPKPAPKKKYSLKATLTAIQTTESLMNRDYTHPTAKESQYKKAVSPQKLPPPPAYQKYSEVVTTSKEDEKSDNISTIPSLPERNEKYYKH